MVFVFCFSTMLGIINLKLQECFLSPSFKTLIYCLIVWTKCCVLQCGLASWLPSEFRIDSEGE